MARTTAEFLDGLKKRVIYPANQALLSDSAILKVASDLLQITITKSVKSANQGYLLTTAVVPIVADQGFYDIPYRAVANGIEDVKFLLDDGETLRGLAYITVEQLERWSVNGGNPQAWYFQEDQIGVVPKPSSAVGSIKFWYHRRLPRLCLLSEAGQITNISSNVVTVSNAPSTFVAGYEIDFIKDRSPPVTLGQDVEITNVAGTQLTFATDDMPSRLAIGDWVAPAGYSPIVPLVDEAFRYFEGAAGISVLNSIGDYEGAKRLEDAEFQKDKKDFETLIEPRIDGEPQKIVDFHSLLRTKSSRPFGRW